VTRPEIPQKNLLDLFPRRERETVLSFLTVSSRKARTSDEVLDSLCLSISLKHALRAAPN
jgi:hypothetical protein